MHLSNTRTHPTADELHSTIQSSETQSISRATVYNALDALVNAGLCRKITTQVGPARFDADVTHHHHIVDESGRVYDVPQQLQARIPNELPADLIADVEQSAGISIDRVSITFHARTTPSRTP